MTSASKETPDRADRAEGQDIKPVESPLEMLDAAPHASGETLLPPESDLLYGSSLEDSGPRPVVVTEVSAHDFFDAAGADGDELRRLENSIRWLMDEGSVRHIPRAATLPPVSGLTPVETIDHDSLLLDPDNLFAPRPRHRRTGAARSAAKILLAGAIAAPATYFIASWMEFPGTTAPSGSAAISDSVSIGGGSASIAASTAAPDVPEERIAVAVPPPKHPPPEAQQSGSDVPNATPPSVPQPETTADRGVPAAETSSNAVADAGVTEVKGAPERPPGISASPPPTDPVPGPVGASAAQSSSTPPVAVSAPSRPVMSAEEIALMLERGRSLFDAGDLAAARLFFRRAANAGDASAALAMGATYDPDILARRFIRGIEADPEEARRWYERARELGSPEGPRRIDMLAHR